MTTTTCPECGHLLWAEPSIEATHSHVGAGDEISPPVFAEIDPEHWIADHSVSRRSGPKAGVPNRARHLVILAVGLAVILAGLAVSTNVLGNRDEAKESEPGANTSLGDRTDEAVGSLDSEGSKDGDAPVRTSGLLGNPKMPPSDEHLRAERLASTFDSMNPDRSYAVIYPAAEGLQMIDATGYTTPQLEVAVGFEEAVRLPTISDGNRTWAINPEARETAWIVSTQFVVVDTDIDGSVAFINNSVDPLNVGISSFGAWGPGFNVPTDSDVLAIPGRGLLVIPDTGGTFKVTTKGVTQISTDRAVAASRDAEVYRRCDASLVCDLYVRSADSVSDITLNLDLNAPLFLSPDGRFVLTVDQQGATLLIEVATTQQVVLGDWEIDAVGWSDDTELVLIASGETMFIKGTTSDYYDSLPLENLPTSPTLLVVSSAR